MTDRVWHELVKEQYFYSGGSLREFCRPRDELRAEVQSFCIKSGSEVAKKLVRSFGGDRNQNRLDRILRTYITDPSDEVHYRRYIFWHNLVDSGYALKLLGQQIGVDKQFELYVHAKSISASFSGIVYELFFHHAVHQTLATKNPVVLKLKEGSDYETITIRDSQFQCRGSSEMECYDLLTKLPKNTYWHPDYPTFPFIDAVVLCEGSKKNEGDCCSETILAYIQLTIKNTKTFQPGRLLELNQALDKNPNFANIRRVYVVVVPDSSTCVAFTLKNAPESETILAMIGFFEPDKFVRQE